MKLKNNCQLLKPPKKTYKFNSPLKRKDSNQSKNNLNNHILNWSHFTII